MNTKIFHDYTSLFSLYLYLLLFFSHPPLSSPIQTLYGLFKFDVILYIFFLFVVLLIHNKKIPFFLDIFISIYKENDEWK